MTCQCDTECTQVFLSVRFLTMTCHCATECKHNPEKLECQPRKGLFLSGFTLKIFHTKVKYLKCQLPRDSLLKIAQFLLILLTWSSSQQPRTVFSIRYTNSSFT